MMSENILLHCFICISLNISGGEFFPPMALSFVYLYGKLMYLRHKSEIFKWCCSNLIYNFAVQEKKFKINF